MQKGIDMYNVVEMFSSVQGEGTHVGTPAIFLRFGGCNRNCWFCDTDWTKHKPYTLEGIVQELDEFNPSVRVLVITGGEPLLQVDEPLLRVLSERFELHLETNGSIPLGIRSRYFSHITCSPKQNASDTVVEVIDDLKLLFPYQYQTPDAYIITGRTNVFLQPIWVDGKIEGGEETIGGLIEELVVYDGRLSLQTHKYLGVR